MLNKIKAVDFQSKKAPEEFVNSLVKTGFAVVKNHSIDFNLINKVYDIWDDFLNQMINLIIYFFIQHLCICSFLM